MLSLKNPFARSTTPPSPAESLTHDVNDPNKVVKHWQLEQGRTKKRVEELRVQLETARLTLAEAEQAVGSRLVEELDVTTATETMRQASDRVRVLDAAVTIAIQKDNEAIAALQQAERELKHAEQDEARERLVALADEGEELFIRIKLYREDLVRETVAAYAAGGIESWGERDIMAHFDFYVTIANRSAAADKADSGAFRKYPNWTTCLKYVCGKIKP